MSFKLINNNYDNNDDNNKIKEGKEGGGRGATTLPDTVQNTSCAFLYLILTQNPVT